MTQRISSHVTGPRRWCALSDKTFSEALALTFTRHLAVMLSTTHHRSQHCTVGSSIQHRHNGARVVEEDHPASRTGTQCRSSKLLVPQFRSYQLVSINQSGCDKCIGTRRTGWSPIGTPPVQAIDFTAIGGIIFWRHTLRMASYSASVPRWNGQRDVRRLCSTTSAALTLLVVRLARAG